MFCRNDLTGVTNCDEVELVTVVHDGGLSRRGGGDAIPGCGGRRFMADDRHASIGIGPESGA